jgi:hypothetical protein
VSDKPSHSQSPAQVKDAQNEARAAEAAAIRRRWVTLGEALAVIAVVISALTLWNNWSERNESEAAKSAAMQRVSVRATTLLLIASPAGERELVLKPASAGQSVQSQTLSFPTPLRAAPAETTGEPRIEAEWFERALTNAREKAGLPDDSRGDERLPVAITTRFVVDGEAHEDVALYDIGYTISGRLLGGHNVTLRGLSFVSRVKSGQAQAMVDARWAKLLSRK